MWDIPHFGNGGGSAVSLPCVLAGDTEKCCDLVLGRQELKNGEAVLSIFRDRLSKTQELRYPRKNFDEKTNRIDSYGTAPEFGIQRFVNIYIA